MKKAAAFLLVWSAISTAKATTFAPQAAFSVAGSTVAGMDRDAAGNLYVLARVPGTAMSYTVASYQPPSLAPEFSFGVTITTPLAFAVEANGVIDILDAGNALTLTRWDNAGNQISQVSRISPYMGSYFTAAFDKANSLFYLSYPNPVIQGTGDFSFKVLYTQGAISQYNFSGQLQRTFDLPGQTTISTTCYTPSMLSVDDQSTLWIVDPVCNQVLAYNSQGTQSKDISLPYAFFPEFMWTGPGMNIFITHAICDAHDCLRTEVVEFNSAGVQQNASPTSFVRGEAWDSRILYMASTSGSTLQRFILDASPTAPVPSSPQGFAAQHSSMATLNWQTASDADGDPLLYSVYIGVSPSQMSFAGSTTQTSFVSAPLAFGTTFYWQATTQDSYLGLPMVTSTGAVVNFGLSFSNNPPGGFAVAAGTGTAATRNTSVTLAWQTSMDPDGDSVLYNVSWQPVGQSSATIITTAGTSQIMTGLSYGTSYYWSVAAVDPYGATTRMSAGTQVYYPVFKNSPPSVAAYVSTDASYSLHTTSPTIALSWLPSTDPDNDPVAYQLDVQTSIGSWPSLALGSATNATLSVQLETTYYWRVEAADPYGGVSTGAWMNFIVHLANQPPNPIAYTSVSSVTTRAATFALSWQNSGDPDGDAVTYGVYASTDPTVQPLVQQGAQTAYTLALQFGATVYWRVSGTDAFGARTDGSLQTFLPILKNSPPPAPTVTAGSGVVSEHSLAPQARLAWSAVQDPDGDPVVYQLFVGGALGSLSPVQLSSPTAYELAALDGKPYYWQVAAVDPFGAASTSAVQSLTLTFQNNPPGAFSVLTGTGTLATRTTSQLLTWGASTDSDGDAVVYALTLSTTPASLPVVQLSSATNYALSVQFGTTYYWTVSAFDGFGGTTTITGGTQSFLPVFLNQAPQIVQLMPPFNGSPVISTMRGNASVSWNQVTTPQNDPVTYTVYLGNSAGNAQPLVQIGQITQAGATSLSLRTMTITPQAVVRINGNTITLNLSGLDYYRTYYIQIQASNPYGATSATPFETFSLVSANGFPTSYNYPNPFSPLRGGTNIVFNAPPSGYARATVSVYSELGDLLSKTEYANIPPGISQQPFNGRDRYGRALFNGSYVCRVRFEGPDDKATFYLLVVK